MGLTPDEFRRKGTSLKGTIQLFCALLFLYAASIFFRGEAGFFPDDAAHRAIKGAALFQEETQLSETVQTVGGTLVAISVAKELRPVSGIIGHRSHGTC